VVAVSASVSRNLFRHNTLLDNTSGSGSLRWRWLRGKHLSGEAGVDYNRTLSGFAYTRVLAKDMLDTQGYFGKAAYHFGPRWTVQANARHRRAAHSASVREIDNSTGNSGGVGLEYETGAHDTFDWDYQYTGATYPQDVSIDGVQFDRRYRENTLSMH